MLLILDANEYIFGLGISKKLTCEALLEKIAEIFPHHNIRIPRLIVREVQNNLSPEEFKKFVSLINTFTTIDEDISVPFDLVYRFELMGLKPADSFIAAYTQWVGAEILVSENRHFLLRQDNLPFRVINAERCLKLFH